MRASASVTVIKTPRTQRGTGLRRTKGLKQRVRRFSHGYRCIPYRIRYAQTVATNPVDPIEQELERVLADPSVRASLAAYRARRERDQLTHEQNDDDARRIVGLPPRDHPDE